MSLTAEELLIAAEHAEGWPVDDRHTCESNWQAKSGYM